MTKISVIIPVYNSKLYIENCITSILEQDFNDFEVILIDDGSTDGSEKICDKFALKDKRIKVFHRNNSGISKSRNYALKMAKGEYIAFIDHDDIVRQGILKDNYELAKKYDADIVKFGRENWKIKNNRVISKKIYDFNFEILDKEKIKERYLYLSFTGALIYVFDALFKRDLLIKNKILFNLIYTKGGEDVEFCNKCIVKSDKIVLNNKIYYVHYSRIGYSTGTKYDEKFFKRTECLLKNLKECITDLEIDINENNYKYYIYYISKHIYNSIIFTLEYNRSYYELEKFLVNVNKNYIIKRKIKINLNFKELKFRLVAVLFVKKKFKLLYMLIKFYKSLLLRK